MPFFWKPMRNSLGAGLDLGERGSPEDSASDEPARLVMKSLRSMAQILVWIGGTGSGGLAEGCVVACEAIARFACSTDRKVLPSKASKAGSDEKKRKLPGEPTTMPAVVAGAFR
jgi:hypothetical protein